MDLATAELHACDELMARTWSWSSGSDSDGGPRPGIRKRRPPSATSTRSEASELSDVSEPGDDLDCMLNECTKHYAYKNATASPMINPIDAHLIAPDLNELPVIDHDMLDCLPEVSIRPANISETSQPVLAIPVTENGPSAAGQTKLDNSSADNSVAQELKLDKRQRNKIASAKCRKNKRIREAKVREELEQLHKKVCTLQKEKQQMQSQLDQFRKYFSQQNLSSALLSGLCVICAVICLVAPRAMATDASSQPGSQSVASPTARSLLSVTAPPYAMDKPLGLQAEDSVSTTELLLGCLSLAQHTAFQEVA